VGLDEAYMEVTGFDSIHGSIRQMAEKMKQRIYNELGLRASVGIAGCKVAAKVASEASKPDGLIEVPPGEERDFLSPLPVEKLPGVGKHTLKLINSLGVRTIGDLAKMPPHSLKVRLGRSGEMLHNLANGIDDREILPPGEGKSISRETTFEKDTRDRSLLETVLWTQSEKIGAELRKMNKKAKCVTLKLRYADFNTVTRSHTLAEGIDTDRLIFETGIKLLDRVLTTEKKAVRLIGLGISKLIEASRQAPLFNAAKARTEALNRAVDQIRDRFGFEAIQSGRAIRLKDILM